MIITLVRTGARISWSRTANAAVDSRYSGGGGVGSIFTSLLLGPSPGPHDAASHETSADTHHSSSYLHLIARVNTARMVSPLILFIFSRDGDRKLFNVECSAAIWQGNTVLVAGPHYACQPICCPITVCNRQLPAWTRTLGPTVATVPTSYSVLCSRYLQDTAGNGQNVLSNNNNMCIVYAVV